MRITRRKLAERHGTSVRTIARRQRDEPDFPKSIVDHRRHYFDLDEVEQYERRRAAEPHRKVAVRPPAGSRDKRDQADATA
jgi:hypothetical protein